MSHLVKRLDLLQERAELLWLTAELSSSGHKLHSIQSSLKTERLSFMCLFLSLLSFSSKFHQNSYTMEWLGEFQDIRATPVLMLNKYSERFTASECLLAAAALFLKVWKGAERGAADGTWDLCLQPPWQQRQKLWKHQTKRQHSLMFQVSSHSENSRRQQEENRQTWCLFSFTLQKT